MIPVNEMREQGFMHRIRQGAPASTIPDKEGYVKNRLTVRI